MRTMSMLLATVLGTGLAILGFAAPAHADTTVAATFTPTGGEQSWAVPAGVTKVHIVAVGARGGDGADGGDGSAPEGRPGQRLETDLALPAGVTRLYVEVGQPGGNGGGVGFGGAADGGFGSPFAGGGGGGASDVRTCPIGGPCDTLGSRLIVAGGGGGGGGRCFAIGCAATDSGNDGSDTDGGDGGIPGPGGVPGFGGAFGAGGQGGPAVPGGAGGGGGGGGGGWYGGGGGASGYLTPLPLIAAIDGGDGGNGSNRAGPGSSNVVTGETDQPASITISYLIESTTLVYTGATAGPIGQLATLKARLTATTSGFPVQGAAVTFTVAGLTCAGITNASGEAQCTITPAPPAGIYPLTASYAGDIVHHPSTVDASFEVKRLPTVVTYTGPTDGDYHDPATVAATLTSDAMPVAGKTLTFTLNGADSCTATTTASGQASCVLTPEQIPAGYQLEVVFAGDAIYLSSQTQVTFTVTKEETALSYVGDQRVANGEPATLSAKLAEDDATPVAWRNVTLKLGPAEQSCTAVTAADGVASCVIAAVDQDLNAAATLPVTASFTGDDYYLPSTVETKADLQYLTGRAWGLSANVTLPLGGTAIPKTPDTGKVRTPDAATVSPECVANLRGLVSAKAVCASVDTSIAPGVSTARATTSEVTVSLVGLPPIVVKDVLAISSSSCTGSTGQVAVGSITVAGIPLAISTSPNTAVSIPGIPGAKIVINEQTPIPGGLSVVGVHIVIPSILGVSAEIVIAAATSDIHNCK